MALTRGKSGALAVTTLTGYVAELRSWSIDEDAGVQDVSTMGDDWSKADSTLKSWKGSCSGFWDPGDADGQEALVLGALVLLTLYPGGNTSTLKKWAGSAVVSTIKTSARHDGHVDFEISFEGSGALTKSTIV